MKKIIYTLLTAASICACSESFEDRLTREAEEYTKKNCPVKLTENITNDSMTYDKGTRTVNYFYSVESPNDSNLIDNEAAEKIMKENVINATTLQKYKDEGINFRYIYLSAKSKKVFCDITVTEKDYKMAR